MENYSVCPGRDVDMGSVVRVVYVFFRDEVSKKVNNDSYTWKLIHFDLVDVELS